MGLPQRTARRALRIKSTCTGDCAATSCGDTPRPAGPTAAALQAPFQAWQEEGRLRLLAMLQRCMIRASKAELWNLPRLHRTVRSGGGRAGQPGQQAAILLGSYGGAFCGSRQRRCRHPYAITTWRCVQGCLATMSRVRPHCVAQ